jgi:hypothetical protein
MHVHEYTETKHTETAAERLLPNIWTHGIDGSIHPPNMSNYPRLSSVTELLAKTFPYHLEDLGIESLPCVDIFESPSVDEDEGDGDNDDDDKCGDDFDEEENMEYGSLEENGDLSTSLKEPSEDDDLDSLVQLIQDGREHSLLQCNSKEVHTEHVFMNPSHHDIDINLGGACSKECLHKHDSSKFLNSKLSESQISSSSPASTNKDESPSLIPSSPFGTMYTDLLQNDFSPMILEGMCGIKFSAVGEADVFAVLPETIRIDPKLMASFFFVNSDNKLARKEGFGVVMNGLFTDVDGMGQKIIWTLGNLECHGTMNDGQTLLKNLEDGQLPTGRAKIGLNFHCGKAGCIAKKKLILDNIECTEDEVSSEKKVLVLTCKTTRKGHSHASKNDLNYSKPSLTYDPYKPQLVYNSRTRTWDANTKENQKLVIDFGTVPEDIIKNIPRHLLKLPDFVESSSRDDAMRNATTTVSSLSVPKGKGRLLHDHGNRLLSSYKPDSTSCSMVSYQQSRVIRERALADNKVVEAASKEWILDGDVSTYDYVVSLQKYCNNKYKDTLSPEMMDIHRLLSLKPHFLQEVGELEGGYTYAVLLDMASVIMFLRDGNGVLLSVGN